MGTNKQYVTKGFSVINSRYFRKRYKSASLFFDFMRSCIIREEYPGDLGIWDKYWRNGYLACSKSTRWFAKQMGCSNKTILKWLNMLEQDGAFIVEKVKIGLNKEQNVYVMGTHNGAPKPDYKECFYLEDRFSAINTGPVVEKINHSIGVKSTPIMGVKSTPMIGVKSTPSNKEF